MSHDNRGAKRRKIDTPQELNESSITSHTQLRALLVFQQNPVEAKKGVRKFKEFLNSISQTEDEGEKAKKLRILKAYCDSQTSHSNEEAICFPDLIQTWNFADSNNTEALLTNVPSVLALFIKTVSSHLEFREFGIALCKHLLAKDQLRLFNRGLTANKVKEHLVSPCLRLLTEIVSFDGGALARQLYLVRHITFKRIDVFLTPNKAQLEEAAEDSGASTLRRNAQRYVLANLRFQNASNKTDIIEQQKVMKAFLEHLRKDPRDIVLDVVRAIERDVIQDSALPRTTKTKFFSRYNLERLVTLYGYDRESEQEKTTDVSLADEIHKILMTVCTKTEHGVLLSETGWYPNGSDPESLPADDEASIDLGLDSAVYVDKYRESVPIRNGILSYLIQVLRPDSDSLQIELLLAIFKAAPELVADYFTKKSMFMADPKPTPAWLAESTVLFSTVTLPVLRNCGWKDKLPAMPPPVSVVIESILPRPLTQKVLSRCLNMNAEIITLFAVRILSLSFTKLRAVLKIFRADHGVSQSLWTQAADKLVVEFCHRCPLVKDVLTLFRRTAKDDLQQQDAVMEMLACFYEVIPDAALEESFDVSLVLVDLLKRLDEGNLDADDTELLLSQLQNILKIAQQSASLRWWQQPGSMKLSAFTSILKVCINAASKESLSETNNLLKNVLAESSVILPSSFSALLSSFDSSDSETLQHQLAFFDNCACRIVKKPVHYYDLLGSLVESTQSLSPLVAATVEQWPFIFKAGNASAEKAVAEYVASLLAKLGSAGEDLRGLKAARDALVDATEDKKLRSRVKKALKGVEEVEQDVEMKDSEASKQTVSDSKKDKYEVDLEEMFGALPVEGTTHNELYRWEQKELEVSLEQGRISELFLCLCSEHEEVRRQALPSISRFMSKLKESSYPEWRTAYTLSGELLETVKQIGLDSPVPWIVGECAANCLSVLLDPMHKLYGKVNKFLQKAPSWEVEKIPSYWIDKIFLHEPELDDGYFEEISWLLDLLRKGLRTERDMEIYRRANVFERVLAFYESPSAGFSAKRKVLHLVYRAVQVQGSTTLITRAGIISWIQCQLPEVTGRDASVLTAMAQSLYESSDRDRAETWSGGAVSRAVEHITV
ncbi:ribosome 60S biogenesis N-terminal-domain-containing protein [Aspergillus pseudodeflectus]|uniref:Ribosome 60S biogenesis N-terminal-domain-containing protein n=1 Tax=Aspergillus pseudodeflectus TaxID=176178 RepID=A0ABR4KMN9_9EURO